MSPDETLLHALAGLLAEPDAHALLQAHRQALARHGDWSRWQAALAAMPCLAQSWRVEDGWLLAGAPVEEPSRLVEQLKPWIPWRKGPLCLGGVRIDTEWRSDLKWDRLAGAIDLRGARVLDVGAGNGYFGWRMLEAGARAVIGCDPTPLFVAQHQLIRHFAGPAEQHLLGLRLEDLPAELADFDAVFSMGVLYHRRDPLDHLRDLARRLRPGGELVLETLIIDAPGRALLDTSGRYANMRNVHGLPSLALLLDWLVESGFSAPRCLDQTATTAVEQRQTDWMPFHSLEQALDPDDPARTREGHPAPLRAVLRARAST